MTALVYADPPHTLSSFQKWALLHLHNSETGSSVLGILKACCITAMTDNFQKRDVTEGLARLEKMGLIRKCQNVSKNTGQDGELSDHYSITGDGVIYTKKMLRLVLDLLASSDNTEKIAQKISDGKTKNWLRATSKSSAGLVQQEILERIIAYGLGNIGGLGQLLEIIRKNLHLPA